MVNRVGNRYGFLFSRDDFLVKIVLIIGLIMNLKEYVIFIRVC